MIKLTQPDSPNTLTQKYRLTEKQKRITTGLLYLLGLSLFLLIEIKYH
ncbi:hypothetical protein SAMN05216357_11223 [Porphyromonadaceae bacterium KH3CP3RA]|nr:hypothetical protein SAMN05216357_11223 [Porphyromonadaceae bacterium KH3CP3RA]